MKQYYFFLLLSALISHATIFSQNPAQNGEWSEPLPFGIVPVAVANLPDGRLLTWSSQFRNTFIGAGDGATFTEIFDPFLGEHGQALGEFTSNTDHDMFCPGINNLVDGRILSAGGTSSTKTSIYDPNTGLWSVASEMNIPRGYQGNVTLSDGSVFTIGGSWSDGDTAETNGGKDAELWSPETGWVLLPGITGADIFTLNDLALELYSTYRVDNHIWLWPAPNGQLFHAGPSEMMHWIDVSGNGTITEAGLRANDTYSMKGTTVMFDIGRILKVGGAESYSNGDPAKEASFVIDINDENNVTVTPTANSLTYSRTMHNSTVLPNGEVLVTGGLDRAEVFSDVGARLTAEIYNPGTNSWRVVSGMATPRTYHSVAILMTDGRVFVGGGGLCDGSNPDECVNHFDAEIYSPPYLFDSNGDLASRPLLDAPETADYNSTISVSGSTDINEICLIRFSAATHSTNNEQRRIPLNFTDVGGVFNVSIPDRNLLPPGYYMMFGLDSNGVPSIAETIQIGNTIPLQNNPNLILSLDFDESSGNTAVDNSGNGNNGIIKEFDNSRNEVSLSQTYWNSEGLNGGALEMDGLEFSSNTILEIPTSISMQSIQDEITVMAWVYRDENEMNAGVFSHDYPSIFFGFHNSLYKWEFPTSTGGSINCYAGYVPTGQWVHMAATYDGQTARLYANGVELCTQYSSGSFVLENTNQPYSSFTSSGFYDVRPISDSGVTDELDGRIDELKVFNKVLGQEEINNYFQLGQQVNSNVAVCPPGTIVPEYRIGIDGEWQIGSIIAATPGSQVFIRAQVLNGEEYFITTKEVDSPTFSSLADLPDHAIPGAYQIDTFIPNGDGSISLSNEGQYVVTSASGCAAVIELSILPTGECENGVNIVPEYRLDGEWLSGQNDLTVSEGTEVVLSILPNNIGLDIYLPDGTKVFDNYDLGAVTAANSGTYLFTTYEGCVTALNLTVGAESCPSGSIIPEYTLDGVVQSGAGSITVDEGTEVILSMLPDGIGVTITLPDGSAVGDNHNLGNVVPGQSGLYTFTSAEGCSATLQIDVLPAGCAAGSVIPEYTLDGVVQSGAGSITVDEGTEVILSMLPDGIGLTITLPDGSTVGDNHNLGNVVPGQSGLYTFTSAEGCIATLDIQVTAANGCPNIIPEYRLDGEWLSGQTDLTVSEGTEVMLSMLPNGIGLDIYLPDGTKVWDNYDLGAVTAADSGTYLITTWEGCQIPLNLTVGAESCPSGSIIPEYTLDGVVQSGAGSITVDEGTEVILSMLPDGIGVTITLPDGSAVGDNHNLGNVVPGQSGLYTFTSAEGCSATLQIDVLPAGCAAGSVIPEYTLDGVVQSGAGSITVDEGTEVILSMLPDGIGLTITLPDGSTVGDNHNLGNVVPGQSGLYTFTSAEGCIATLDIQVTAANGCPNIIPEYRLDGEWLSGQTDLTVSEGTEVMLSMLPNGIGLDIYLPDGTKVWDNYDLGAVTAADSGTYLITTWEGCQIPLNLTVGAESCPSGSIIPEYTLDGVVQSGAGSITVDEGTEVILSMLPDGIGVTITLPDGSAVGDNHNLGNVVPGQSGLYTFTSAEGCSATLQIDVLPAGCAAGSVIPEYTLDGVVQSGAGSITVDEGTEVILSMLPDGIGLTITLPDGSTVGDNHNLGNVVPGQSGLYTFTSAEGCIATLDIQVTAANGCPNIIPEYRLDGEWLSGQTDLTVSEGTEVMLSMLPNGIGLDIYLPDGTKVWDNYDLGAVTAADSGTYLITTWEGCQIPLNLTVEVPSVSLTSRMVSTTNTNLEQSNKVFVYPNPVNNSFNVFLGTLNKREIPVVINIYDMSGRLVSRNLLSSSNKDVENISTSSLSRGTYFVEILDHNSNARIKTTMIVKK